MNDEQRAKYEKLKEKVKRSNSENERRNNRLLKECIESLDGNSDLLNDEEETLIYHQFKNLFVFSPWGINWSEGKNIKVVKAIHHVIQLKDICSSDSYYIIWGKGLPIVRSDLSSIIKHIDDITAVDTDTWILSTDNKEIIEFYHEGRITFAKINEELSFGK